MNKIKLIIADMDGTLLDDNHRINSEFWEVLDVMKEKGILFSVASGRQYYALLKYFESVKNDIVFICENGSYVVYRDEELFSDVMKCEDVEELVKKTHNRSGVSITLCGKKNGYIEKDDPGFKKTVEKYYERVSIVEDILKIDDEILKVSICEHSGVQQETVDYYNNTDSNYTARASTDIWIDAANKTADKGEAVEFIQKKLNIRREETAAFGDYLNDLEMMESAGHSYAMKNAHPDIKKTAECIVGSNNENGVVEKIKEILSC